MSDSVKKTYIKKKRFYDVSKRTTVSEQNENEKTKITAGSKDTNFKVPEKLIPESDLKSKGVWSVFNGSMF